MSETSTTDSTNAGQPDTAPASSLLTADTGTAPAAGDQSQQQTQGPGPAASTEPPAKADAAPAAAEYVEFNLPQGIAKDSEEVKALVDEAKALGLTQEAAQKFLDREFNRTQQQASYATEAAKVWAKQTAEDTEFGGEKLKENIEIAKRGLEAYGSPALKTLLEKTGLHSHPEIIRAFWKAGKTVQEDKHVGSGMAPAGDQTIAARMYPNMNP